MGNTMTTTKDATKDALENGEMGVAGGTFLFLIMIAAMWFCGWSYQKIDAMFCVDSALRPDGELRGLECDDGARLTIEPRGEFKCTCGK